jgi:hypothetical protein
MGNDPKSFAALRELNKYLLAATPHAHKGITLDIDTTEIIAQKADVKWTYNKNPGYMPMVGHMAETGQIVALVKFGHVGIWAQDSNQGIGGRP